MSETLEQIDKRISEELFGTDYNGMTLKYARRLVAALGAQKPVAWVTGGDCYENGHIDCVAWATGEFTTPLFAAPVVNPDWQMRYDAAHSELARMTDQLGECRNVANDLRQQRDDLLALVPRRTPGGFVAFGKYYAEQERVFAPPHDSMAKFKHKYLDQCDAVIAKVKP